MSDNDQVIIPDATGGLLGRNVWHDPENRNHPARGVVFGAEAPLINRIWATNHLYDQLLTSSCTMQAAAGVLASEPFATRLGVRTLRAYNQFSERLSGYERSKHYDPWPGTDYDGTSTDAPFKLLRAEKRIKGWRWLFGLHDVLQCLANYGPCSIGINWHEQMFTPDPDGAIHPMGDVMGGHAVELYGINVDRQRVSGINSWGTWGPLKGYFSLSWTELDFLLQSQGEAVTIQV